MRFEDANANDDYYMQDAKGGKLLLGKQMITLLSTQFLIRSSNSVGTYNNSAEDTY
jgi:hypothetical protein